jgi:hypothetical protein
MFHLVFTINSLFFHEHHLSTCICDGNALCFHGDKDRIFTYSFSHFTNLMQSTQSHDIKIANKCSENVAHFRYLGTTKTN